MHLTAVIRMAVSIFNLAASPCNRLQLSVTFQIQLISAQIFLPRQGLRCRLKIASTCLTCLNEKATDLRTCLRQEMCHRERYDYWHGKRFEGGYQNTAPSLLPDERRLGSAYPLPIFRQLSQQAAALGPFLERAPCFAGRKSKSATPCFPLALLLLPVLAMVPLVAWWQKPEHFLGISPLFPQQPRTSVTNQNKILVSISHCPLLRERFLSKLVISAVSPSSWMG